ncbi:MAG: helix-turn-helix domain-containing protein, partial [gamma proteobacterium symbiont of Bathyaustriella thionipta]|nr:helix-turn-helix domain-containing protein [gamma proteobacterium symbiont of Bathyaustriella thionipta]
MEQQAEQQELKDIIASREDGFGFLFKQARSEKKLSIDDVARELRLDKKIILALENEDDTQLPAPAFVCGYIRNYAKFLNVQSEPLIEYYKKEHIDERLEPQLKIRKDVNNQKSAILPALVVPLLWLLLLVVLAAGGWQLWSYFSKNYQADDKAQQESLLPGAVNDGLDNEEPGTLLLPDIDASYDLPAGKETMEQDSKMITESSKIEAPQVPQYTSQEEDSLSAEGAIAAESASLVEDSSPVENSLPVGDS